MTERDRLLNSIATLTADYRSDELCAPTPEHVDRWVNQFPAAVQQPMLAELEHVFGNTYITQANVIRFLSSLVINEALTHGNPAQFWGSVKFLSIQQAGNSQKDMLKIFDSELRKNCGGLSIAQCGAENPQLFLYLDDILFTGSRVRHDLISWIQKDAPAAAALSIVTIGVHLSGRWYTDKELKKAAANVGKKVTVNWWSANTIEDRKAYTDKSDVLRPTIIPPDQATQDYVNDLGEKPVLRKPGNVGVHGFFSSEDGRNLLEQEFLKKGVYIRTICPYLTQFQRPLGNMVLKTTGFGSMIVTFRNCPNNAPLALWAGNPWYPLFARKTN